MRLRGLWMVVFIGAIAASSWILLNETSFGSEVKQTKRRGLIQPEFVPQSIIVEFKSVATTVNARERLHRKMGTVLAYRSRHFPIDVVRPRHVLLSSEAGLRRLCDQYSTSQIVARCSVDSPLTPHFDNQGVETPCEPNGSLPGNPLAPVIDATRELARCKLVDAHGLPMKLEGKLSPLWGYEFIGVDLAKNRLKSLSSPLKRVTFATWERVNLSKFEDSVLSPSERSRKSKQKGTEIPGIEHGTNVQKIIIGEKPFGIANEFGTLVSSGDDEKGKGDIQAPSAGLVGIPALDNAIDKGAKVFEISTSSAESVRGQFNEMRKKGIIVVESSGNRFPSKEVFTGDPSSVINVGALSALGGMASYSTAFPEVTIAAPTNITISSDPNVMTFGGTSASQPVATGCILLTLSVLPDLDFEEMRNLLVKTAIPTLNHKQSPQLNGAGTINCLKLVEVATRLRQDWPKSRDRIDHDPTLYNFTSEAKQFKEAGLSKAESKDVCIRSQALTALRNSFLLDPNDHETIRTIAKLYRSEGLAGNAWAYESLLGVNDRWLKQVKEEAPKKGNDYALRKDALRLAWENGLGKAAIKDSLESGNDEEVFLAATLGKSDADSSAVKEGLLKLVSEGKLDGENYDTFFELYVGTYHLGGSDFFKACKESLLKSLDEPAPATFPVCYSIGEHHFPAEAKVAISELIQTGPPKFRDKFLELFQNSNPAKDVIPLLESLRGISTWTPEQARNLDRIIKLTPVSQ